MRARARARWFNRLRAWLLWTPFRPIAAYARPIAAYARPIAAYARPIDVTRLRAALEALDRRFTLIELAALDVLRPRARLG